MSVETFVRIFVVSATATSIGIEIIKKLFDAFKWKYNSMIVASITAFIVGAVEVIIYAAQGNMPFNYTTAIYSICMGLANVVGSTVGYDTMKKFIYAMNNKVE